MISFSLEIVTSQLFWLIVSFIICLAFLSKYPLPKIGGVIKARNDKIKDALDNANYCQQEASKIESECEARLNETRNKATTMIIDTNTQINAEYNKKITEIDIKINNMIKDSNQKIEQFKQNSSDNLYNFTIKSAQFILKNISGIEISEEIIKRELDDLRGQ